MLSVARLVSFWRCIPVQYNCQKSSNFQGLSHFSRIFGKNDKIPGFFQAGKTVTIFPGFPGAVGTLLNSLCFPCVHDQFPCVFQYINNKYYFYKWPPPPFTAILSSLLFNSNIKSSAFNYKNMLPC